jgi:hypothetical protein
MDRDYYSRVSGKHQVECNYASASRNLYFLKKDDVKS